MSKMLWVFATYKGHSREDHIKPSCCHPLYHRVRSAYVFEKYGATIDKLTRTDDMQIDFGGMICTTDPSVDVVLGKNRKLSCWKHQASEVVACLEAATAVEGGRLTFYRFARWPGVLCFISSPDRDKVLRALKPQVDVGDEQRHSEAMHENLVQANVHGSGRPESVVRQLMRGPNPNN